MGFSLLRVSRQNNLDLGFSPFEKKKKKKLGF